ncbi:MAG TPA: Sua5/YciO/YrdC/YwlC family protein [Alphaproteobacteria bacterium]|nr:Sua5/YciO/YrdC/YwlC family protein [Alphaproteobacteria bacterium]
MTTQTVSSVDIAGDARRAFDVLKAGGIAILPMDVGYSLIGGGEAALKRIFETKQRAATKLNAMVADNEIHREVHMLDQRGFEIVEAVTRDHGLPLGAIAPARLDHPLLKAVSPETLARSHRGGTIAMLLNAGPLHAAICHLSRAETHPLFGSSANLSLSGTKFRVEDIEPEIRAIADIAIDHGLRKYHHYKASSTLLDVERMEVVRHGACFELIADVLQRSFGIALPPAPTTSP